MSDARAPHAGDGGRVHGSGTVSSHSEAHRGHMHGSAAQPSARGGQSGGSATARSAAADRVTRRRAATAAPTAPRAGSGGGAGQPDYAGMLRKFYSQYVPEKAGNITAILRKYHGKEASLFAFLEKKYKCRRYFQRLQLDLTSPFLDPAIALEAGLAGGARAARVAVPWPGLPALDNVSKCRCLLPVSHPEAVRRARTKARARAVNVEARGKSRSPRLGTEAPPDAGAAAPADDRGASVGQGSGSGSGSAPATPSSSSQPQPSAGGPTPAGAGSTSAARPTRARPTPFDEIAGHYTQGPLSTLKRCFDDKSRVRVTVRRIDGIRGTLTGFLIAFDRHMNMVLIDADEVYTPRPRKHDSRRQYAPASSTAPATQQRHLPQVLVRGDCVVTVCAAP